MTAIGRAFTATLQKKPPATGGWTYAIMADPAEYSATRGLACICDRTGGLPFRGSSMALGEGTRKLAVKGGPTRTDRQARRDAVTVHLEEPIPPAPRRSAP